MTDTVLAVSLECTASDTTTSITNSLNKFFNKASGALGGAFDMVAELNTAVGEISEAMEGLTTSMSNLLEEKLVDFVSTGLTAAKNFIFNKFPIFNLALKQSQAFANAALKPITGLFTAFGCIGSAIKGALKNTIANMLTNMVKKGFTNPIECAVTDFIGALTGKITSMMDGIIGPLIKPIESLFSIVGNAFGSVAGFLGKGLNIIGKIQGLLNCKDSGRECHVQDTYTLNGGSKPKNSDAKKQNIITRGINNMTDKINNVTERVDKFGEKLDGLTSDVGTWGIFGGSKEVTREQEIKRLEKEIKKYKREDGDDVTSVLNQLNKRLEEINAQIDGRLTTGNEILVSNGSEIRTGDWWSKATSRGSKYYYLGEFGSFNYTSGGSSVKPRSGVKRTKQQLIDASKTIKDYLAQNKNILPKLEERKDAIQKEINELSTDTKYNELVDELEKTKALPEGSIIKNKVDVTKDITREEAECNGGNPFKCGLPKVEIFGGNGEGAVGEVILGNFLQEVDTAINETEVDVKVWNKDKKEYVSSNFSTVGDLPGGESLIKETAGIIGVDLTYPGEGYTEEPLVRFADNCEQGYGAYGRAEIDKDPNSPTFGQLTGIVMLSVGENYPSDGEKEAYVERIVVEDGGSGYKMDDKVGDFEICGLDENGAITKVCTNDKPYRTLPPAAVQSATGSGAILTPVMSRRRRRQEVVTVIDCITPRGNIVGYVNGKEYNGPFHVMPNGTKMTGLEHSGFDSTIYGTPQESLRSGGAPSSNVGSTRIKTRSIRELVNESESIQTTPTETYVDPVDESGDTTPPPSTPPSSGGGGYGGGY